MALFAGDVGSAGGPLVVSARTAPVSMVHSILLSRGLLRPRGVSYAGGSASRGSGQGGADSWIFGQALREINAVPTLQAWVVPVKSRYSRAMPQYSFDVSTGVDLQEVDNASNQARKEIAQRYDFRGSKCTIEFERKAASLTIEGDDAFRVKTVIEVLREKLIKRKVPVRNLDMGEDEPAGAGRVRRKISLIQGIDSDTAKKIVKEVKAQKFKKAQVAIQGEELRVSSPAKDVLQEVITFLKSQDYGIELEFGNYR